MNNGNVRSTPPETIQVALERAAGLFADRGLAIFDGRGRSGDFRTYRELFELACTGAARLRAHGVREGEPVLVALPPSWSWVEAWFGVRVLGGLPVAISVFQTLPPVSWGDILAFGVMMVVPVVVVPV